ncbi:hypothetical protein Pmani_028365 [Petrolisthes manimaculis]|uniref:Uncharacterized protein n=1 Tax=Petrolisthes manimaculis TaxID=1843537 RepID=A0AAE1TUY0_9EUCA|nr:hypothetical protein Pmani_028365 [Petrolisthes manimaculis]
MSHVPLIGFHSEEYFCTQWDCRPPPKQHSTLIFSVTAPYQTFTINFRLALWTLTFPKTDGCFTRTYKMDF